MKRFNWATLLAFLGLLSQGAIAAEQAQANSGKLHLAQSEAAISKSKAADIAKARYGGKVLKVEEVEKNGSTVYRVKLLLDGGHIKIINVDSRNGALT